MQIVFKVRREPPWLPRHRLHVQIEVAVRSFARKGNALPVGGNGWAEVVANLARYAYLDGGEASVPQIALALPAPTAEEAAEY